MYPTPDDVASAASIWAVGLIEAKLSPKQIGIGLAKAITKTGYCPDLPGFIELCKPVLSDFSLPDVDAAYAEACNNAHPSSRAQWSHPAIMHAANQVGLYELSNVSKQKTRPAFEAAYRKTTEAIMAGEVLPDIPKAIEDKTSQPLSDSEKAERRAFRQAALADLKTKLFEQQTKGDAP